MAEENQNVTEQPRDAAGKFTSAELGKMPMTEVIALEAPDIPAQYEAAHARAEAAKAKKEKPVTAPVDLDEKLKQLRAREAGLLPLNDDIPPEEWAKRRAAQLRNGEPARYPAADEEGIQQPEPEPEPEQAQHQEQESELAQAAAYLGLPVDDPFVKQAKEAIEYYGPNFDALIQPAIDAGAQLAPGVGKVIRELPNAVDVLIALGGEPKAIEHLNTLPRARIKAAVEDLSKWVATGEAPQQQAQQKPAKPIPPEPVSGRSSTAFNPSDESMSPDEWLTRRNQELRKRGRV